MAKIVNDTGGDVTLEIILVRVVVLAPGDEVELLMGETARIK